MHPFNLKNVNKSHNSIFQVIKNGGELSGITTPWVYLGMLFATFCFHVEDLYMYALNYLHIGSPKTWYAVPAEYKEKFEEVYADRYHEIFKKKPNVMDFLNLQLNPAEAVKRGIPVYRTEQKAGQFILTFPKVYHGGFSHGFNCGEAVNLITSEWFKYYKQAKIEYESKGFSKKVQFPLSWILASIIINTNDYSFDKPTLESVLEEWIMCEQQESEAMDVVEKAYQNRLSILEFANKNERYDRHVCKLCGCYCYLSYLYCNKCLSQSCLSHITPCTCIDNQISLYIRFNKKETKAMENKLKDVINKQF